MNTVYTIVIRLYQLTILSAACIHPKAKLWINGRKNWYANLSRKINPTDEWIWVHCSSVGEFEDCVEVISGIRKSHTSSKILLTFFSPSGVESANGPELADHKMYLPIDTKSNAKSFLDLIKPGLILFSRSDLWYNFLSEIAKREIPTFLISALVNPNSNFLKLPQKVVYRKCYDAFTQIYCQNDQTKELLQKHFNNNKCTTSGNSRIDRIYQSYKDRAYDEVSKFVGNSFCVIVGSCLDIDEKMILSTIGKLKHLNIKWIIVPHEIIEKKIDKRIRRDESTYIKYSNIDSLTENYSVLYIDFVGGLKHLYKYGNVAVIGGGFNRIGIHNILEPTLHGIPTTFGPNHRNYPEALELIDLKFSTIHHNQPELQKIIEWYYHNPINETMKYNIKNYVISRTGASLRIVSDINSRMKC